MRKGRLQIKGSRVNFEEKETGRKFFSGSGGATTLPFTKFCGNLVREERENEGVP